MPKRPKQLELALKETFTHGGRRKGAGRPKSSRMQSHLPRARFQARHPLHVTVRLSDDLPDVRSRELYRALREAVLKARKSGLRLTHFAVLHNHLHLIVESESANALGKTMQSLGVSFAKRINARLRRKGAVLRERYHVHILKTPSEVKHALKYVLGNEFKHQGKKGWIARNVLSSAVTLTHDTWKALLGSKWREMLDPRDEESAQKARPFVTELLSEPRTWLLREGWRRAG